MSLASENISLWLEPSVAEYLIAWTEFCQEVGIKALSTAQPTAIGWKVADIEGFKVATSLLLPLSEQAHIGVVDGRKIGSFLLQIAAHDVPVVKLMERRPGSSDPTGLDHIDFFVRGPAAMEEALTKAGVSYEQQSNRAHKWLSLRFGPADRYEAKLVDHLVLDVCAAELKQASDRLMGLARGAVDNEKI